MEAHALGVRFHKLFRVAISRYKVANVTACIDESQNLINFAIVGIDEFGFGTMLVEHPNRKELTPNELQSLQKLQAVIARAIADGRISKYEMEVIDRTIHADGKVLVEEVTLVRQLIRDKIDSGLLTQEWDN